MQVSAVVLAAGESRRMGQPKMLLPWRGGTVLGTVVETLLQTSVTEVVVVLGHGSREVRPAVAPFAAEPRVRVSYNRRYRQGMLTSVQCGVREAIAGNILVALGDQPLITPEVVEQILAAHTGGITVPSFGGRRGHPICIDRALVPELLALPPEVGLRGLLQGHPDRVQVVPVQSEAVLIDLDTGADYDRYAPETGPR